MSTPGLEDSPAKKAAEPRKQDLTTHGLHVSKAGARARMPTSLERKIKEARVAFHRRLGVSLDAERPPSPGTMHKLLAKLEAQERTAKKAAATPFPPASPPILCATRNLPGQHPSPSHPAPSADSPSSQQRAAAAAAAAAGLRGRSARRHSNRATQDMSPTAGPSIPLSWSLGGKGRRTPHININLSILPSATQQWQADKTLYYSPIGPSAGTAPHQFPSRLREGMLMYFSPMKKVAALQAWARMDQELKWELQGQSRDPLNTSGSLEGPTALMRRWSQGAVDDCSDIIGSRLNALADQLGVHPESLWDLLDSELQAQDTVNPHSGVSNAENTTQQQEAQNGKGIGQPSRSRSRRAHRDRSRASSAKPPPPLQTKSHAALSAILRRAPVVADSNADNHQTQAGDHSNQPLIQQGLTQARHKNHTQHGTPVGTPRIKAVSSPGGRPPLPPHRPTLPLPLPSANPGVSAPVPAALSASVYNTMSDVLAPGSPAVGTTSIRDIKTDWSQLPMGGHHSSQVLPTTSPFTSPRGPQHPCGAQPLTDGLKSPSGRSAAVNGDPAAAAGGVAVSRQGSPARAASPRRGGTSSSPCRRGQPGSPVRVRSPIAQTFVPGEGMALSQRYVAAARNEEWHPGMPGAVRPCTASQWDYQTGVYNAKLADELFDAHQQEAQQAKEAQANAMLEEVREMVRQGSPERGSRQPSPDRASRAPASPPHPAAPGDAMHHPHVTHAAWAPTLHIHPADHLPPITPYHNRAAAVAMDVEDTAPRPPNARALRAAVGRSIIRRHALQHMPGLSQKHTGGRGAVQSPGSDSWTVDSTMGPSRMDAAYALTAELHALAKQFGVRLDGSDDDAVELSRATSAADHPVDGEVHSEAKRKAQDRLRAALQTPGIFEWDRLLFGQKPDAQHATVVGPGPDGHKPASALLAKEIRLLRHFVRDPNSPLSGGAFALQGEFAGPAGQGAQAEGGTLIAGGAGKGAARPAVVAWQQPTPLIAIESDELRQNRKLILQLHEVRAVRNLLWNAEKMLVPLRQQQRNMPGFVQG